MLSLILAAFIAAPASLSGPQAVQATLQSCAMEGGRWVCRYAVPDIEIVPLPGNDIVADAPSVILGVRPDEAPSATEGAPTTGTIVEPSATPAPVEPDRRALTLEGSALTEREARLVARCAEAGWMSLCLPDDRRAARALRDKEAAYTAVRLDVTRLLADDRCDDAVKAALDSGYLALARETRAFCAASLPVAD
jgi:hypothetical protein